jgi:hypothetical protein
MLWELSVSEKRYGAAVPEIPLAAIVPGGGQRFLRAAREGETPAQCGRERHVLHTLGLRLQTPTKRDVRIMHAAASNAACIAALASAGFIPAAGPDTHSLPDGRVAPVRWFRHESAYPTVCEA